MSCEYCKQRKIPITTPTGELIRYKNFCDNCGEPLAEPKPIPLERLRQMNGEPVWCKYLDDTLVCGIIDISQDDNSWDTIDFVDKWERLNDVYKSCKGLVYAHKPKTQPAPKKGGI